MISAKDQNENASDKNMMQTSEKAIDDDVQVDNNKIGLSQKKVQVLPHISIAWFVYFIL